MKKILIFCAIISVGIATTSDVAYGVGGEEPDSGTGFIGTTNEPPGTGIDGSTTQPPGTGINGRTTSPPGTGYTGRTTSNFYLQNPLNSRFDSVGGIIEGFLEIFTYLVVLFAVLMLIWVGFQFVLARGKSERLKELKTMLLWIIVGVAIVIGARIIVGVIINTLEATQIVSPGVIQNANNALRRP